MNSVFVEALTVLALLLFAWAHLSSNVNETKNVRSNLPRNWRIINNDNSIEEEKEGLDSIDFIPDIPIELKSLRNRLNYRYTCILNIS